MLLCPPHVDFPTTDVDFGIFAPWLTQERESDTPPCGNHNDIIGNIQPTLYIHCRGDYVCMQNFQPSEVI